MIALQWTRAAGLCALALCAGAADDTANFRLRRAKFVELTNSWAKDVVFTPAEQASMRSGKQWEELMTKGPDDPLAKRIMAAGEPSYEALCSYYPGKVLDRTILGSYSDPHQNAGDNDEFAIYWNGAIAANLVKGKLSERGSATQPIAFNTAIEFRVGSDAEMFGRDRVKYTSIGYERRYLPIVTASYEKEGVRYRETAFAYRPQGETSDLGYVAFEMSNASGSTREAQLFADIILNDGSDARFENGRVLDQAGAVLMLDTSAHASFDSKLGRVAHRIPLRPGETRRIVFKVPFRPDSKGLLGPASEAEYERTHDQTAAFWSGLLAKGASIEVPEQRWNDVWRALLLQNFVLADGPRFTYGSGLAYNDSTYPYENGFATHVFAMYGYKDYADAMQAGFLPLSVSRELAGHRYQNRRAMVLHHLLENYRLTGKTDLYDRFKSDYYHVADEIVFDRHSTMVEVNGDKPLSWGLLPPDRPAVDTQASTQTVYVPGHNITNCQGLQDFGRFLIETGLDRERGQQYLAEAADFRRTLMSAMKRAAIRVPGRPPFVDLNTLYFRQTPDYGPEPYDDLALGRLQGTYYHYWVDMELHYNFFNPHDDVGQWLADYVHTRNGFVLGMTRARPRPGEPFGWINNVYDAGYYNYRLRAGQLDEFIFGLYARLAFGMSRHVYVASEGSPFIGYNTQDGGFVGVDYSFPNSAANADTLLMLRNALVMEELHDNIETGKLWLLKGAPRAWFQPGKRIKVQRLATYFGDVSFDTSADGNGRVVRAEIEPPAGKWKTIEISLQYDGAGPFKQVRVNGHPYSDFDDNGHVRLHSGIGKASIEATY